MTMSKETLLGICKRHSQFFCDLNNMDWIADDVFSILDFASDILEEEAKALEKSEPHSTKCIDRLRTVAYDLYVLGDESYEVLRGENNG